MRTLSKILLSVATFFVATDNSFAQSFSNTPNDTINTVGIMDDLETLSIQQLNISADTISLKWKKISESIPLLWEASVCDNSICNTSLVDSGWMNPVNPADYGLLLIHITAHVNYGTAVIRYAVWDVANPTLKDTLTYIFTVNAPSGIAEAEDNNSFSIFPNPAVENIHFTSKRHGAFQFIIYDVSGKEIENGISKTKSISVSIENLPNGVYSVTIPKENDIRITKKFLVQH